MRSLLIALTMLTVCSVQAEEAGTKSGALYDELARMDALVFETAFVTCDADRFRTLFTDDAEFYHDIAGPTFGEDVWTLKSCPGDNGVRRVLVPESLEVYPMQDYGAIQIGEHWFVEDGASTSTLAKFVHLWRFEDNQWRIARVLSFDHQSKPKSEGPVL
ncbi:MAG: nuclear transport factor 2 family protein [Wenzhouxiangellaceae bacterium]